MIKRICEVCETELAGYLHYARRFLTQWSQRDKKIYFVCQNCYNKLLKQNNPELPDSYLPKKRSIYDI
jgi:hypothetical protein